ncbi:GIDE domain-containing protein [Halorientalis salina]|uniref:GIDE domain-containing protein n=1 Tax=Halorientalis salina TaxID=2932266 RepID=UPI00145F7A33|nr:GIDE domain-containing protein [Halorientalis salina]
MVSIGALGVGLVTLVIAGLVGRLGWRQQRRHSLVAKTPTTDVRSIDDEGLVELKGRVKCEEPFQSPIRDEESVLSAWEIDEWDERGNTDMWETRASGVYAKPFVIDDGTGEVQVDIDDRVVGEDAGRTELSLGPVDFDRLVASGVTVEDVYCSFDRFPVETTVPPDADPPERIAEFVEGETGISEQTDSITNIVDIGNKHGERRYYEQTIEPGAEIYLLGNAEATADATYPLGPDDVVITPPADGDGSMIVSDQSEDALVSDLGSYKLAYGVAAAIGLVGVGFLVVGAGVV